jgi:hypothetical protein
MRRSWPVNWLRSSAHWANTSSAQWRVIARQATKRSMVRMPAVTLATSPTRCARSDISPFDSIKRSIAMIRCKTFRVGKALTGSVQFFGAVSGVAPGRRRSVSANSMASGSGRSASSQESHGNRDRPQSRPELNERRRIERCTCDELTVAHAPSSSGPLARPCATGRRPRPPARAC